TWNEDAHLVLGPRFRYRTLDIQQAGPREIAVNLDRLLARGHHLHLVASLVEGDFGKEVLLLLKRVSDEGGNLWALIGHRKSPFAVVRQPCPPLTESVMRESHDHVEAGALAPHAALNSAGGPSIRRNADRTNNAAAFAKNEERSLVFFQKRPRDPQVRVLLHLSRSGLANQHRVIRLGLCQIAG